MMNSTAVRLFGISVLFGTCAWPAAAQNAGIGQVLEPVRAAQAAAPGQAKGTGILSSILGCAAPGAKQKIGAAIGGVAGGFLGNRVAGSGSRTVGTVAGAAVGAAAGSALGCKLQRSDQAKAEAALARTAESGQPQSWSNQAAGTAGSTRVVADQSHGLSGLKLAQGIEPASNYSRIDGSYAARSRVNVRSTASLSGQVIGQLAPGEQVWVPASAADDNWLLVSRDGVGIGYVSANYMAPQIAASGECKTVQQTVAVGTSSETRNFRACRDTAGGWAFTPVTA